MTPIEFQSAHAGKLKEILDSNFGKDFLLIIQALKPAYEFPIHEHLMLANRESIRGYEMCLRNIVALSFPPKMVSQPEANYGVPELEKKDK